MLRATLAFCLRLALVVLVGVGGPLVFVLSPLGVPEHSNWRPTLDEIRAFLDSDQGVAPGHPIRSGLRRLPTEVRYLEVGESQIPSFLVVPGTFGTVSLKHYTFQVVYPEETPFFEHALAPPYAEHTLIIDAPTATAKANDRLQQALREADFIVATSEHVDHVGGIARAPDLSAIAKKVFLTTDQLYSPWLADAGFSEEERHLFQPLRYDVMTLIAPGTVLIKAPGHTFGSQMVFVRLQSGAELLFVGDIALQWANIGLPRAKPRLLNWLTYEDGEALVHQLAYLRAVRWRNLGLAMVLAHDRSVIEGLTRLGLLNAGLRSLAAPLQPPINPL